MTDVVNDIELKKEKKRIYQREYMKTRRLNDVDFNEKQKELNRNRKKFLYDNDEEYKEKSKSYNREQAVNRKNYKKLYEELLNKNISNIG